MMLNDKLHQTLLGTMTICSENTLTMPLYAMLVNTVNVNDQIMLISFLEMSKMRAFRVNVLMHKTN